MMHRLVKKNSKGFARKGFTIFFATLVASLALAIGLAIYDITVRQLDLSTTIVQSQYAMYAADSGAECALYWDSKYGGSGSAFATSSASLYPTSGVVCGASDIASAWTVLKTASAATTTFMLSFSPYSYCATVEVGKSQNGSGSISTTIFSHGYNVCANNAQSQLERELKVNY